MALYVGKSSLTPYPVSVGIVCSFVSEGKGILKLIAPGEKLQLSSVWVGLTCHVCFFAYCFRYFGNGVI